LYDGPRYAMHRAVIFHCELAKLMLVACLNVISMMAYLVTLVLLVNKLMGIGGGKPAHF